jgi:hypothetical protein
MRLNMPSAILILSLLVGSPLHGAPEPAARVHEQNDREFCANLGKAISAKIPLQMEDFEVLAAGRRAAFTVIDNLMIGKLRSYLNIGDLVGVEVAGRYAARSVNAQAAIATAIGAGDAAILVQNVDELRQLPLTMDRREIVLTVSDASVLDQKRAQLIVNTALRKRIKIYTLWTSTARLNDENSGRHWANSISLATGGRFVDLSAGPAICY